MIIREFIYGFDPVLSSYGFKPIWMPQGNAMMAVAHDILDHFGEGLPAAEDELMACGAMFLTYTEAGNSMSSAPAHADLGATLVGVLSQLLEATERLSPMKLKPITSSWATEQIQRAADMAVPHARAIALEALSPNDFNALKRNTLAWVFEGYRRAQKRYAGCDFHTIGGYFRNTLNQLASQVAEELIDGTVVKFCVSPKRLSASAWDVANNVKIASL